MPAGMLSDRCDPYGNATDRGPKNLLGGVYDARYEGRYKWGCTNLANGHFRFIRANGHKGRPIPLCYPHVSEITKRMSQLCPACAFPAEALELNAAIERDQAELQRYSDAGMWGSDHAAQLRRKIEVMGYRMTELRESGRTPNVAGRWEEVS